MEKIKVVFQVQGCDSDDGDDAEYSLDAIHEEIIDKDKIEDTRQAILQQSIDNPPKYKIHDNYLVNDVLWLDLKDNELYRDEDSFHYDFWEYMVDDKYEG